MADGQVIFEITGNDKNINQTIKNVTSNIQSESKKWDQAAGQATGGIESSFKGMLSKVGGMLAGSAVASVLLNWGKAAVSAASDLAEVQNVVDTVFGDSASQIESWAKKAGQQFGLTETQAKKFTSTLGAMMKSSGIAGTEIVQMSTDLAGLAADMASFYNMDFETAFQKIRSGISGETEPLKQLGINMSVANLEAYALTQGISKSFNEMSQGEQTLLRYQYLMQATADAQGDFARTADGFANSQRRIQAALDTISTVAGSFLLTTIEPLISGVADFLAKITTTPENTIFDDFNAIEVDTTDKLAKLEETYTKAQDIIKILDQIGKDTVTLKDGTTTTFEDLFKDIGNVEKNGGDVQAYIQNLGLDVETVIGKYNEWKEATRQLTSLVPGLTSVIDSETGAIDGGTEALQRNLDAWKKNEEKKIYWAEYYAKAEAVARAKGEQAGIQITAKAQQIAADRAKAAMESQAVKLGIDLDWYNGNYDWSKISGQTNVLMEDQKAYNDAVDNYVKLQHQADEAQKKAESSASDLSAAEEQLALEYEATVALVGEEEKALEGVGDAADKAGQQSAAAAEAAGKAASEALKALQDYEQSVRDSTAQTVNSVIKGFDTIQRAGEGLRKQSREYAGEETEILTTYQKEFSKYLDGNGVVDLKKMGDAWDDLSKGEQEAYNKLVDLHNKQKEVNKSLEEYKPEGMKSALQSQLDFMTEYLDNLNKAQEMGLSDELLASLSDGSAESAEYLAGIVEGGADAAKSVDELFQKVQDKKKGFTEALSDQKLAADEMYQSLLEKWKSTVADMNIGDQAQAALAETVAGMASGIESQVPAVAAAVDDVLAEVSRLGSVGVWYFDSNSGGFDLSGLTLDGSHETGLDVVPFNGYLAELHAGEGILTAEENRIWQRFKNGQGSSRNVDYEQLGGLMRDNVKAGGNVYLDRRIVGEVVSQMQGNQYRTLQRSGWQS